MNPLKKKIFKISATFLAACGITTTFTACYGMPLNFNPLSGTVKGDNGDEINPIKGIKVYDKDYPRRYELTDSDGRFEFFDGSDIRTLVFEDIDVEDNGSWQKKETDALEDGATYTLDPDPEILPQ